MHINIIEDKSLEGTSDGLEKTTQTVFYSRQPCGGVEGALEDDVLLQDLAVDTHVSHSDLVRACGRDLLLRCQMLLSSMLYCMQNVCGRRLIGGGAVISVEGVAPSVGACGTGKEEDGVVGVWITSPYR